MKISIVIPVYNEKRTIRQLLETVEHSCDEQKLEREIIVVDDASSDGTTALLRQLAEGLRFTLLVQEKNGGKGTAVRRGIAAASGDIVLIQDADLEYSPDDYPALLRPILAGRADVVYGSRFLGTERKVLLFWHTLGNKLITFLSNMFTNLNLTDVETCYKAFRREIIQNIHLECRKFDFEIEVTVKVAKMKCRIFEVPVSYNGRTYEEGKKIRWYDGISALAALLKYSLRDD
jgi:glycosyltransferase involved in cell wall biosynthesis